MSGVICGSLRRRWSSCRRSAGSSCWRFIFLVSLVAARRRGRAQAAVQQLVLVVTIVTVLLLGGTAIFIDCQRAIVLGLPPAVGHALKLRPGETRVLRAVCVYWLIVHLVPTLS